jgi:nitrogen regulatory protein P-II 1
MKMVQAIIEPFKLDAVKNAIGEVGATGLTISEIKGIGRQRHTELYRGAEYRLDLAAKVKIELVVDDEMVDRVVQAIFSEAGNDGKIFVLAVEEAIRVRTVKRGETII